ncbi:helix-turn-helix domain-containing protein [Alteromonadaceae bacterium M269]|nr:helix-turn-helix domain-containing protein [Alteromonadaceae bacterium M269]
MGRRTKINVALLKAMRKEAGLTQKELASRIGISRETVSAIENEKPETINSIEAEVVSAWHITCQQRVSSDTGAEFLGHIMKYFGFSEQNIINMAKKLSGATKRD